MRGHSHTLETLLPSNVQPFAAESFQSCDGSGRWLLNPSGSRVYRSNTVPKSWLDSFEVHEVEADKQIGGVLYRN